MVYGMGTLKLLASNHELRDKLASGGVMRLMANTLQCCTDGASVQKVGKSKIRNILVQVRVLVHYLPSQFQCIGNGHHHNKSSLTFTSDRSVSFLG